MLRNQLLRRIAASSALSASPCSSSTLSQEYARESTRVANDQQTKRPHPCACEEGFPVAENSIQFGLRPVNKHPATSISCLRMTAPRSQPCAQPPSNSSS